MGIGGITIVASSGMDGAHGITDDFCQSTTMNPFYPAASPWVTAIGSTMIRAQDAVTAVGYAAPACASHTVGCLAGGTQVVQALDQPSEATSGGGFSVYSVRPTWQDAAVTAYLETPSNQPPPTSFMPANRGYPDVSFLGNRYLVHFDSDMVASSGVVSIHVGAAIFGAINSERAIFALPLIGFVNPLLYQMAVDHPAAFMDITIGQNDCTAQTCTNCLGLKATAGWDAATGLGSINWVEFVLNMAGVHNVTTSEGLARIEELKEFRDARL